MQDYCADLVDIRLLLRERQFLTFPLYISQQTILKQFIDDRVFERFPVGIFSADAINVFSVE